MHQDLTSAKKELSLQKQHLNQSEDTKLSQLFAKQSKQMRSVLHNRRNNKSSEQHKSKKHSKSTQKVHHHKRHQK
jgi:hypothetical protein